MDIIDINPLFNRTAKVLDEDGDPQKGGGAKSGKSVNEPLGRGSTGRTEPKSLNEKLSIEQAISNPAAGRQLPVPMTDLRWHQSEG